MVIFNRDEAMERVDHDEDLLGEIIEIFLEDTPVQLARLKDALKEADQELVERQAHSVKGAASNIGAEDLRDVAFRAEQAARDGDLEEAGAQFAGMMESYESLALRLKESI